jgi:hypothetical protein
MGSSPNTAGPPGQPAALSPCHTCPVLLWAFFSWLLTGPYYGGAGQREKPRHVFLSDMELSLPIAGLGVCGPSDCLWSLVNLSPLWWLWLLHTSVT